MKSFFGGLARWLALQGRELSRLHSSSNGQRLALRSFTGLATNPTPRHGRAAWEKPQSHPYQITSTASRPGGKRIGARQNPSRPRPSGVAPPALTEPVSLPP